MSPLTYIIIICYAFHIHIGTYAVVSIMCANAVQGVLDTIKIGTTDQPSSTTSILHDNTSIVPPTSDYLEAEKIKIHTALCLLVGLFQVRCKHFLPSSCLESN